MAKILLVDDSKTLLKFITQMLVEGGHEVVAVASGQLAVEHLAQARVDVVLTDLYMPAPDGFEIVQSVRDMPQRPALIVMSSSPRACSVYRDSPAFGAAAVLEKPFTTKTLMATIAEALARPGSAQTRPATSAAA